MSKGKYKRKRAHRQRAKQKSFQGTTLQEYKQQETNPEESKTTGQEEKEQFMGLGKGLKSWGKSLGRLWEQCSLTDRIIAVFTVVLAVSAIYQFIIMSGQLDVMRKDQRAWMMVAKVPMQLEVGKILAAPISVSNTGKTPAKKVNSAFRLEILSAQDSPSFNFSDSAHRAVTLSGHATMPNSPPANLNITSISKEPGMQSEQPIVLNQPMFDRWNKGEIWLAMEGQISYEDIFHKLHWTHVCFVYFSATPDTLSSTPDGADKCSDYNDTDD